MLERKASYFKDLQTTDARIQCCYVATLMSKWNSMTISNWVQGKHLKEIHEEPKLTDACSAIDPLGTDFTRLDSKIKICIDRISSNSL